MSRRIPPELMDMIRQRIERTSGERPPPELMDAIRQRMESNVARRSSFAAPRICYHTAQFMRTLRLLERPGVGRCHVQISVSMVRRRYGCRTGAYSRSNP